MPHRPPLDLEKARRTGVHFRKNIQSYRASSSYAPSRNKLLINHFKSANMIHEKFDPPEMTRETAHSTRHDTTAAEDLDWK